MKSVKIIVLLYFLLAIYSCDNKKNNKDDVVNSNVSNITTEKSIIKETEQLGKEKLQLIELILTTSPRYLEITKGLKEKVDKNGGLDFGVYLERSPEQSNGKEGFYSNTYDFTIYEMYEERRLNTSRFSFNPENKQLYEYNIINDSLVPIEYNRTLLLKYDSLRL